MKRLSSPGNCVAWGGQAAAKASQRKEAGEKNERPSQEGGELLQTAAEGRVGERVTKVQKKQKRSAAVHRRSHRKGSCKKRVYTERTADGVEDHGWNSAVFVREGDLVECATCSLVGKRTERKKGRACHRLRRSGRKKRCFSWGSQRRDAEVPRRSSVNAGGRLFEIGSAKRIDR